MLQQQIGLITLGTPEPPFAFPDIVVTDETTRLAFVCLVDEKIRWWTARRDDADREVRMLEETRRAALMNATIAVPLPVAIGNELAYWQARRGHQLDDAVGQYVVVSRGVLSPPFPTKEDAIAHSFKLDARVVYHVGHEDGEKED